MIRTRQSIRLIINLHAAVLAEGLPGDGSVEDIVGEVLVALNDGVVC